jgi:hypothetical protein
MPEKVNGFPKVDRRIYIENRRRFRPEDLRPYAGQWVAWSADGSRIVAHHEDLAEAVRLVEATGLQRDDVVFDHLLPEGEMDSLL